VKLPLLVTVVSGPTDVKSANGKEIYLFLNTQLMKMDVHKLSTRDRNKNSNTFKRWLYDIWNHLLHQLQVKSLLNRNQTFYQHQHHQLLFVSNRPDHAHQSHWLFVKLLHNHHHALVNKSLLFQEEDYQLHHVK